MHLIFPQIDVFFSLGGWKGRGEHGTQKSCTAGEKDEKRKREPAEEDAAGGRVGAEKGGSSV